MARCTGPTVTATRLRFAPMAITAIIPTLAPPMGTTDRRGSAAASLLAPVPGSVATDIVRTMAIAGTMDVPFTDMDTPVMGMDGAILDARCPMVVATTEGPRLEAASLVVVATTAT